MVQSIRADNRRKRWRRGWNLVHHQSADGRANLGSSVWERHLRRHNLSVDDDELTVLAAAEERARALVDGNAADLERLLHPDLQWTTYRGDVLTRSAYIAGNMGGSLRWLSQHLEEPKVIVVGDTAVLTAVVVDHVQRTANPETHRLRLTQTWVRDRDAWRCLAGHAGPPI